MSRYTLAHGVRQDLKEIRASIVKDNRAAADRMRRLFIKTFRQLASQPLMGQPRPDLGTDLRITSLGNYVILFRPKPHGIEVHQVAHGARDIDAILRL